MTVSESIELMKREGARLAKPIAVEGLPAMEFSCSFAEDGVSPQELSAIHPDCARDISEFWKEARDARLFADQTYGQWGLEILDPQQAAYTTRQCQQRRSRDFVAGDLVVGKFLGDSDLLVIRNDATGDDFGTVLVALPVDPRAGWYCVGKSFAAFLDSFIKAGGDKYWTEEGN